MGSFDVRRMGFVLAVAATRRVCRCDRPPSPAGLEIPHSSRGQTPLEHGAVASPLRSRPGYGPLADGGSEVGVFMAEPDDRQHDRLSPQTVHDLLVLLTVIRGQEHMIKRWVRLRDDVAGVEQTLERLATTDALILRLASELIARQTVDDGEATDDTR